MSCRSSEKKKTFKPSSQAFNNDATLYLLSGHWLGLTTQNCIMLWYPTLILNVITFNTVSSSKKGKCDPFWPKWDKILHINTVTNGTEKIVGETWQRFSWPLSLRWGWWVLGTGRFVLMLLHSSLLAILRKNYLSSTSSAKSDTSMRYLPFWYFP